MSIARKLFRLFKFFNEYATIKAALGKDTNAVDKYLQVLTRLAFLLYWVFDNLGVLIKVKFIKSMDMVSVLHKANTFWLLGLVLTVVGGVRSLMKLAVQGKELKLKKKDMGDAEYKLSVSTIKATRKTAILTLIKAFGDTTTASQGLGYPKRFLGVDFNDGVVGLGGFTSAAINCYQQYPK